MWMKDDTECMIDNIRKRTKTTCSQHNKERCRKHQVRFFFEIDKRTQAQQGIQEYCPDPVERSYTE